MPQLPIRYVALPRAARLMLTVWARSSTIEDFPLGSIAFAVDTSNGQLRQGEFTQALWRNCAEPPMRTCVPNALDVVAPRITSVAVPTTVFVVLTLLVPAFRLPRFLAKTAFRGVRRHLRSSKRAPPVASTRCRRRSRSCSRKTFWRKSTTRRAKQCNDTNRFGGNCCCCCCGVAAVRLRFSPLIQALRTISKALPKYLLAIDWFAGSKASEARSALHVWARPSPVEALALLGRPFADEDVRVYAIECLDKLSDADVADFLLQLTQSLKHERHDDSPLARWLLARAWRAPDIVGHAFFWFGARNVLSATPTFPAGTCAPRCTFQWWPSAPPCCWSSFSTAARRCNDRRLRASATSWRNWSMWRE